MKVRESLVTENVGENVVFYYYLVSSINLSKIEKYRINT